MLNQLISNKNLTDIFLFILKFNIFIHITPNYQIMNVKTIITSTAILFLLMVLFSCKEENKDPCEDTEAPDKSITMIVTVKVEDETGNPISNEFVEIKFEKHPCGGSRYTVELIEANTDLQGEVKADSVTITLSNTADDAFVTATAPDLNSSKKWSNRTYHYDDFEDGHTADLLLVIKIQ